MYIIAEPYTVPKDLCWAASRNGRAAIYWNANNISHAGIISRVGEYSITVKWPNFNVTACYISPNAEDDEFDILIDELEDIVSFEDTDHIIGGDFNSRAHLWGCNSTNDRGETLLRWSARKNINLLNVGNSPTCVRPQGSSIVDLTWANAKLSPRIMDWQILKEYTASDHLYIYFVLDSSVNSVNNNNSSNNSDRNRKAIYNRWAHKKKWM